ncbi:MAG: peptidylprolyl isomerase [Polyangiaceae bacterium]
MRNKPLVLASLLLFVGCAAHRGGGAKGIATASASCVSADSVREVETVALDARALRLIDTSRREGLVAVAVRSTSCGVDLEVIRGCHPRGLYRYAPKNDESHRVASSLNSARAAVGANGDRFASSIDRRHSLRLDRSSVGSFRFESSVQEFDLASVDGADARCARATHVVSEIDVGEMGAVVGDESALESQSSLGASPRSTSVERIVHEGDPTACARARSDGLETDGCTTPVRLTLLPIRGAQPLPVASSTSSSVPVIPVAPTATSTPEPPPVPTQVTQTDALPPIPAGTIISVRQLVVMYQGSRGGGAPRSRAEAKARADLALRRAQAGDDFAVVTRQFTDEPKRASKGGVDETGVLENIRVGMTVQRFEDVAFRLRVGEISGVVETEFGFHVIRRLK